MGHESVVSVSEALLHITPTWAVSFSERRLSSLTWCCSVHLVQHQMFGRRCSQYSWWEQVLNEAIVHYPMLLFSSSIFLILNFTCGSANKQLSHSRKGIESYVEIPWFQSNLRLSGIGQVKCISKFWFWNLWAAFLSILISKWAYVCVKSSWKPWKCVRDIPPLCSHGQLLPKYSLFQSESLSIANCARDTERRKGYLWPVPLLPDEFLAIPQLLVNTYLPRRVDLTSPFGKKMSYQLLSSEPWLISPKVFFLYFVHCISYLLLQIMLT